VQNNKQQNICVLLREGVCPQRVGKVYGRPYQYRRFPSVELQGDGVRQLLLLGHNRFPSVVPHWEDYQGQLPMTVYIPVRHKEKSIEKRIVRDTPQARWFMYWLVSSLHEAVCVGGRGIPIRLFNRFPRCTSLGRLSRGSCQ
jgi:hypothetical protein